MMVRIVIEISEAELGETVEWLDGQIVSRLDWLETHGGRSKRAWPETDLEAKRHGLKLCRRIRNLLGGSEEI